MQKGKHQVGQTQGYSPRNYSAYPGNPDNSRQYFREVPAFHASGTPGGGPGMRGMHHAPPTQPPTPPTSQDIKQPPAHLPPQAHQMPPQSGGQIMQYSLPGAGRGSTQQTPFYPPPRAPLGSQRMTHARPSVVVSNSAQSFMSQPVVPPVYQGHVLSAQMSGQGPVYVAPPMNQPFQIQQPRHQGGSFYSPPQYLVPGTVPTAMFTPYQQVYYPQSIQTMSRAGGPAPSSQGAAPAQPQPPLGLISGPNGAILTSTGLTQQVKTSRPKMLLKIINPTSGRNIFDELDFDDTSSRSGESSARQTPQPNTGQKTDQGVAAEFATRVAIAARVDHTGSPNPPALQKSSSGTSNYSESESQASPDSQGMFTPSVSPSKLDTSVESISSESQIVENNITYDGEQTGTMMRGGGWPSVIPGGPVPVELLSMPMHAGMMIPEEMMRAGSMSSQPAREYQTVQQPTQWISDGSPVPVSIMMSEEPASQMQSPLPRPEQVTPVVSALAHGPTVDIGPRPQREQFPVLGKGHQQQSPVKRKQRSEKSQEQGDSKMKDQLQQPPQQQQSKVATQAKHKNAGVSAAADTKKQQPQSPPPQTQQQQQPPLQSPPSQDSEEYVQSVQTKSSEPKTIIIKKNDSDSSGTKTKTEDSLRSKESNNNVDSRSLSEEKDIQDTSRVTNENVGRCATSRPASKDRSPTPLMDAAAGLVKVTTVESSGSAQEKPEVLPAPAKEAGAPSKTNGETVTDDDAKSNNQKSKPGNKRPAQSKMRLEAKDSRIAGEPNPGPAAPTVGVEATQPTSAAATSPDKISAPAAMPAVVNNEVKKVEEELSIVNEENKEKNKDDSLVNAKNESNKQTTSGKANDPAHVPSVANKLVLKHNYERDQWSPINPEGKKKYDRQFIMGLQNQPQSLRKPTNFPNLELLSDNKQRPFDRNVINSMNRSHVDNIYPSFASKNSSQRGQTIPKRGSQQGKPKPAKPTVVQVSLQQDVKLHETENAWKPSRITENTNMTDEEAETEALYKRVKGILNKLTPEKLDKLVAQIRELPIDNSKRLEGVIELVFKKAVDEPSFSVAYAQMCHTLHEMEVPCEKDDGKTRNFRKLLVEKCQNLYEKNGLADLNREERLKEIEQEKNPEKKKALQLALEEDSRRNRMKSVGNIRFIGELYKLKMLNFKVMVGCVTELLNQEDEESLECLCKLLTTVGQGLEAQLKSKGNERVLNEHFKKLHDIVKNKGSGKVSSRVRFMIQDLIDLKANKWVPRRNESQPKTIDQIQKEAERETIQMNLALNAYQEKNRRQDVRNSLDGRKRGGPDSFGWTTVTNSQPNKSKLVVESSKLKLDQSDVDVASTLSLGNRNLFMWSQGANSGKMDDKRSSLPQLSTNKFAVLSTSNTGNYSVKGSSLDKDKFNSYKSVEEDARGANSKSQQDPNSRSSSRESASSKRDASNRLASPANNKSDEPTVEQLDEIERKAKSLLDDYLSEQNLNDAKKDLDELFIPSFMKDVVCAICTKVMEKKGTHPRKHVGILMNHFIASRSISKEQFLAGLSKVLETADDLAIDTPCLWEYLAEILAEMCAKDVITFKDIVSVIGPIKGSTGSAKFLAALVKLLVEMKDAEWLKERWLDSQVSLTDIIDEKDVNDFVKKNNVDFMLGKNIKLELSRMIAKRASFDEINTWVSKNVGDEKSTEPLFVRTLMAVLLEAAVTKNQSYSYKFDQSLFANYEQLIVKYTNHNEDLELPCLFAIQAFVHKLEYPATVLSTIFHYLWDTSLIATESFNLWRHSKNPQEQEGHAVCVTSLTSFFTHLDETETDDES